MLRRQISGLVLALVLLAPTQAMSWSVTLGTPQAVTVAPDPSPKLKFYHRDGRYSTMPSNETSFPHMIIYPGFENFRLLGTSRFIEDMKDVEPATPIFGGESTANFWGNGGQWLNSVHRIRAANLLGFVHGEYHWYPHVLGPNGNNIAWMSVALTQSYDNGITWAPATQILTSAEPIPAKPEWGGVNNPCGLFDAANNRWLLWYGGDERIHLAMSPADASGKPTKWWKYYNGAFTEPGIGGKSTPLKCLDTKHGTLPSVIWNTYLNRWVMAYHSYGRDFSIYMSTSIDGINWDCPRLVVKAKPSAIEGAIRKAWFPTIVGPGTDKRSGRDAHLYYLDMQQYPGQRPEYTRDFIKIPITFSR
jgi:hypothetical protein